MNSDQRYRGCSPRWVSPFGNLRINARLAAPRSFSQPPTSFVASWRQGIHHTPLVAYLPKSLEFIHAHPKVARRNSRSRSRSPLFATDPKESIHPSTSEGRARANCSQQKLISTFVCNCQRTLGSGTAR